jgi:hypothetical protein
MGRGWREIGRMAVRLYQARSQGQTGQVGAAAAAGLVPDPVQVRADRADADVQLVGDLGVGAALGDQGDQLPCPGAELARVPAPPADPEPPHTLRHQLTRHTACAYTKSASRAPRRPLTRHDTAEGRFRCLPAAELRPAARPQADPHPGTAVLLPTS